MQMYIALQPLVALIAGILILIIPPIVELYSRHLFNRDRNPGIGADVTAMA